MDGHGSEPLVVGTANTAAATTAIAANKKEPRSSSNSKLSEADLVQTEKASSAKQRPKHKPPTIPKYWEVYPVLIMWFGGLYYFGLLKYALIYYAIYPFISPFGDWMLALKYFARMFRPYEGYPLKFNAVPVFGVLMTRALLLWPIETILWHLDDILFPGYRSQAVEKPMFLLGQPRSGTTKLEEILSADDDNLVALRLIEMRFPYMTVQYFLDGLVWIDKHITQGLLKFIFFDTLKWNYKWGWRGERHDMRRLRYDDHDEDDIIFLFHQLHHFQNIGFMPDPEYVHLFHHFEKLPDYERRRIMLFHRKCVQKVLYRRGNGRRYFAKWVAGWNGQLDEARVIYPDAQFLVIVRRPEETLPSWFKLLGLLSIDMSGYDFMTVPKLNEQVKLENKVWFRNQIEFCKTIPPHSVRVIMAEEFYKDIPGNVRKIYEYFDRKIVPGSPFDAFLNQQQANQASHKKTQTDETHITQAEIREFPDIVSELAPLAEAAFGKRRRLVASSPAPQS